MLKVSFKDGKVPSKSITKLGNRTLTILVGNVILDDLYLRIPGEIKEWIRAQKQVEVHYHSRYNDNHYGIMMELYAQGLSECHPEDKYNTLLGERLAEGRAKLKIYKFMHKLSLKMYNYYNKLMYGCTTEVHNLTSNECLAQTIIKYEGLAKREELHLQELLNTEHHGE